MSSPTSLVAALCGVLSLVGLAGCEDDGPSVTSLAPRPGETPASEPVPVAAGNTTPVAYAPSGPDGGTAARAPSHAGGGGGGGGGARPRSREGHRAAAALEEMSAAQAMAMIDQARNLAQAEDADDGCARLAAGFGGLTDQLGDNAGTSLARFTSICESMPEEMRVCFEAPSERTDAQQEYCSQLLGTNDMFNPSGDGQPRLPPGTRVPTEQEYRQAGAVERQARRVRRP